MGKRFNALNRRTWSVVEYFASVNRTPWGGYEHNRNWRTAFQGICRRRYHNQSVIDSASTQQSYTLSGSIATAVKMHRAPRRPAIIQSNVSSLLIGFESSTMKPLKKRKRLKIYTLLKFYSRPECVLHAQFIWGLGRPDLITIIVMNIWKQDEKANSVIYSDVISGKRNVSLIVNGFQITVACTDDVLFHLTIFYINHLHAADTWHYFDSFLKF